MFDIAFSELLVIAVVALIVIGPERLPKAARTLGHLLGRLQRYVNDVKADINREMELEELRKLKQEVQTAATELHTSVSSAVNDIQASARSMETELNQLGTDTASATPEGPSAVHSATAAPPLHHQELRPPPDQVDASTVAGTRHEPPRQATLPGLERP